MDLYLLVTPTLCKPCLFNCFFGLYWFVTKTETGLALQATAQDRHAAEILGIPSNKMFAIGWAIGLGCVGVAGGMMANYFLFFTDVGINFALFAFAVALGVWKYYWMFVCWNNYRIGRS